MLHFNLKLLFCLTSSQQGFKSVGSDGFLNRAGGRNSGGNRVLFSRTGGGVQGDQGVGFKGTGGRVQGWFNGVRG